MISINISKVKEIGHDIRRKQRAEELAPLDQIIAAQIPGTDFALVELARQEIRNKYSAMQSAIDVASTPEEVKLVLGL